MGYSNGQLESEERGARGEKGDPGLPGIGFKLTDDGNLKKHTQFGQNNYHLQPSFQFYRDFSDNNSQINTFRTPSNLPQGHFFQNHSVHNDGFLIEKEDFDTGNNGQA